LACDGSGSLVLALSGGLCGDNVVQEPNETGDED
jgi:hypothetical protein